MANKTKTWKITTLISVLIALGSVVGIHLSDSTPGFGKRVIFSDPEGQSLVGHLFPGRSNAFGFILLEGFGSDQVTMRSAAWEFSKMGYVFTFDFSGHGRSPGGLDFNNAETDRLAKQVLAAKEEFKRLTGIPEEGILLVGHSLGARVALQAASMDDDPPAGLILFGTQVNLGTNVQSEFFTGVQDNSLEWVQSLGPDNPRTHILLISGEWDDILTPKAARMLFARLSDFTPSSNQMRSTPVEGYWRELVILDRLLHNYEVFSPRALSTALYWLQDLFGLNGIAVETPNARIRIWLWVSGCTALLVGIMAANQWFSLDMVPERISQKRIRITSLTGFLRGKLILWLAAIPFIGIVSGVVFVLPLYKPVFNLYFVGFIGGYGLLNWLLYLLGKMPGTEGRLPFNKPGDSVGQGKIIGSLIFCVALLLFTAAFARTGWFYVFPMNQRFLWMMIFVPVTSLGFWIGFHERDMFVQVPVVKFWTGQMLSLISLLPFFLYSFVLAVLGSLSGLIGALQGLLILWLVMGAGSLLAKLGIKPWLTAIFQAIFLYWLVLPQGVLFR